MYHIDACEFCGTFQRVQIEVINNTSHAICDSCLNEQIYYEETEESHNTHS